MLMPLKYESIAVHERLLHQISAKKSYLLMALRLLSNTQEQLHCSVRDYGLYEANL